MENENAKTVFLNICKEGKSNEMLKYPLKGIRKGPKKTMVNLINLNVSWMKAVISYAFKHW